MEETGAIRGTGGNGQRQQAKQKEEAMAHGHRF
jgi:hypothetical protein